MDFDKNQPEIQSNTVQPRTISKAAFRRLPRYHQILVAYESLGRTYISSKELSEILEINETLVRKDMADLEIRGRQNQGYEIVALRTHIEEFHGLHDITEVVIIGAGHLGQALAMHQRFEDYGMKVVGIMDNDPHKIGSTIGRLEVLSVYKLTSFIQQKRIKLAVLTITKNAAQEICDIVVKAGVRAIWNFTPQELKVPEGILVRNEQLVAGFMALSYFLKNMSPAQDTGDD